MNDDVGSSTPAPAPGTVARPLVPGGRSGTLVHHGPPSTASSAGGREADAEKAMAELIDSMPPEFWQFHARYARAYYAYTLIHLGDEAVSRYLVDMTFVYLAMDWRHVALRPDHYAWSLLKDRVAAELEERGRTPAPTETLAFSRAVQAAAAPFLASFRERFRAAYGCRDGELADEIELFEHMARLSERHFDVLVLQKALGFSTRDTALIMGVSPATVRSTRRNAKERLAAAMGCRLDPDPDPDPDD
ncbi:RNA polymerase sigma factor [Streptomyces antibioticus]